MLLHRKAATRSCSSNWLCYARRTMFSTHSAAATSAASDVNANVNGSGAEEVGGRDHHQHHHNSYDDAAALHLALLNSDAFYSNNKEAFATSFGNNKNVAGASPVGLSVLPPAAMEEANSDAAAMGVSEPYNGSRVMTKAKRIRLAAAAAQSADRLQEAGSPAAARIHSQRVRQLRDEESLIQCSLQRLRAERELATARHDCDSALSAFKDGLSGRGGEGGGRLKAADGVYVTHALDIPRRAGEALWCGGVGDANNGDEEAAAASTMADHADVLQAAVSQHLLLGMPATSDAAAAVSSAGKNKNSSSSSSSKAKKNHQRSSASSASHATSSNNVRQKKNAKIPMKKNSFNSKYVAAAVAKKMVASSSKMKMIKKGKANASAPSTPAASKKQTKNTSNKKATATHNSKSPLQRSGRKSATGKLKQQRGAAQKNIHKAQKSVKSAPKKGNAAKKSTAATAVNKTTKKAAAASKAKPPAKRK